ncbi:MAG: FKBP-type peptidyl-prolyl cis-trans isomerase [Hyphomonadaceae bacterium]
MIRTVLATCMLLIVAACQPAGLKIDQEDPWKTLYPWDATLKDVQTTENGVQYVVIRHGDETKPRPTPTDMVTVHYDGRLAGSGEQFDSSYGGQPVTFQLNRVIPGWTEGLQKMHPGDEFMFYIPSDLGYGPEGAGNGAIPPNSDLMFRVELLNVEAAPAADEQAWARVTPWPTDSSEVIRKPSGLEYLVVQPGPPDAIAPGPTDYAIVQFEGRLDDGTVVDSTFPDQQPRVFPIEQLVSGWSEALQSMRKGDQWMVRIPPHLMYGADGDGRIPGGATVTWEIRLEDVVQIDPPPPKNAQGDNDADGAAPN